MRLGFILAIVIGAACWLAGDRYGAPDWARRAAAGAFAAIEGGAGVSAPDPTATDAGTPKASDQPKASAAAADAASGAGSANPANEGLSINEAGLAIIRDSEGLRLESYSAGGRWYVGYGHSRTATEGMIITEEEAERLLRDDLSWAEALVKKLATPALNRNQFSALVSLAYNLGEGNFSKSPVLERLNAGEFAAAADAFRIHNKAGGEVNAHLVERREKERALFLTAP